MAENPYAAPRTRVEDVPPSLGEGDFIQDGRGVPAGHGWRWIADAWKFMDGLHENIAVYTHSGSAPCVQAAKGERVAGIALDMRGASEKTKGAPLEVVIPSEGTGWEMEASAIVKGTKHRKEAELFYEFVTTPESLSYAASEFFRIPSRNDIPKDVLPEWMRTLNIPKMDLDWAMVTEKTQEWMDYWNDHIRGSGGR